MTTAKEALERSYGKLDRPTKKKDKPTPEKLAKAQKLQKMGMPTGVASKVAKIPQSKMSRYGH